MLIIKDNMTFVKSIFANLISYKRLISKICKDFLQLNSKKMLTTQLKSNLKIWTGIFSKEDIVNRYMKKYSMVLIIKGMQINITMRYQLTPVRMSINKKLKDKKHWWGCGEIGIVSHYWWECKMTQQLWKIVWRFIK